MPSSKSLWCDQKIYVTLQDDARARSLTIDKPFAIVGTHRKCDVVIEDDSVSSRYLYLHATPDGVYCLPLNDKSDSLKPHWLENGEDVICGRIRLQASTDSPNQGSGGEGGSRPDIGAYGSTVEPIPELLIEQGKKEDRKRIASRRARAILTVVGRSEPSLLRVPSSSLSRCHTALFWDKNKLWAIDLLSTNHTYIDKRRVVAGELSLKSTMRLGEFLFTFQGFKEKDSEIQKAESPAAEAAVIEAKRSKSASDSHVTSRSGVLQEAAPDGSGLVTGGPGSFVLSEPSQGDPASASDSHRNGSSTRRGSLDVPDTEPRIRPGAVAESAEIAVAVENALSEERKKAATDLQTLEDELAILRAKLNEHSENEQLLSAEKEALSEEVARVTSLNKELAAKAEKIEQLEKTLEESAAEKELVAEAQAQAVADSESARASSDQRIADADEEIESLRKRVADLTSLEQQREELSARVSELEEESEELNQRLKVVAEERKSLEEENNSRQASIDEKMSEVSALAAEAELLRSQLNDQSATNSNQLDAELKRIEEAKSEQLRTAQSRWEEERATLLENIETLQLEAEELAAERARTKSLQDEIETTNKELEEHKEASMRLEAEIQRLGELDSKREELESKNEELDALYQSAKKRLASQAEELKELDSIRETQDTLNASNSELQAKIHEQEKALQTQAAEFESEVENQRHQAHVEMEETLNQAVATWNAEREQLKSELASKEQELADAATQITASEETKEKLELLAQTYAKQLEESEAAEVSVSMAQEAFQKEREKLQAASDSERSLFEAAKSELKERLAATEKALAENAESLASKERDLDSIRKDLVAKEQEVASAIQRSENQNAEICLLRQELADAQRNAAAERSDRDKALTEREEKAAELEKALDEAQARVQELNAELEARTDELAAAELQFEERNRALGEGLKKSENAEQRLEQLENQIHEREAEIASVRSELSSAKESADVALAAIDAEKCDIARALEAAKQQLEEKEKTFQEREKGLVEFIEELEKDQQEKVGQSEQLMALEMQLEDAKSELERTLEQAGSETTKQKHEIESLKRLIEKQSSDLTKTKDELKAVQVEAKKAGDLKKKNDGMTAELSGMRAQISVAKSAVDELGSLQEKLARETAEREAAEEMLKQLDEEWTSKQEAAQAEAKRLQTLWEDARSKWEDQSKQAEKRIDRLVKENKRLDESLGMAREETARALKRAASSTPNADRFKKTSEMGEEEIAHATKLDSREVSPISPKSTEHIPTVEMDDIPDSVENPQAGPPAPKPFELGAPEEDYTPGYENDQDSRDPYADMQVLDEVAASLSAFGHSKRRQQKPLIMSFLILLFWLVALSLLFGLSWVLVNAWLKHQNKAAEEDEGEDELSRVTISAPYEVG